MAGAAADRDPSRPQAPGAAQAPGSTLVARLGAPRAADDLAPAGPVLDATLQKLVRELDALTDRGVALSTSGEKIPQELRDAHRAAMHRVKAALETLGIYAPPALPVRATFTAYKAATRFSSQ